MPNQSFWDDATISKTVFVDENATITFNPTADVKVDTVTFNPDATIKVDFSALEKAMAGVVVPDAVEKAPLDSPENIVAHYHAQAENLVFYPRHMGPEGYEECNQGPGPLSFQNTQTLLARFFISSYIDYRVRNWRDFCIGITNYAFNSQGGQTMYMPMFDYDGKNIKKKIRADVKRLQEDFKLGDAWVYHTRRGFHVYFFTDLVEWPDFQNMLNHISCCEGFKRSSLRNGWATLRVSAKYTKFDIGFEYILKAAKPERVKRILQKGYVVQELLNLGQECGTHFASLFPQWAHFTEDYGEWRPSTAKKDSKKRVRKVLQRRRWAGQYYDQKKQSKSLADLHLRGLSKDQALQMMELKEEKKSSFKATYASNFNTNVISKEIGSKPSYYDQVEGKHYHKKVSKKYK